MHGKRYRESSIRRKGGRNNRIWLRILITVICAGAFSVAFYYLGMFLGEKAALEVPGDTTPPVNEGTSEREEITTPQFDFKDIAGVKAVCFSLADSDIAIYDTVLVRLTDREGKLKYLSSVSSLMYGSQFSTTLKPISAAVNDADVKANKVAVSFLPFGKGVTGAKEKAFADTCSLALLKEICDHDVSEILLESAELSEEFVLSATKYVSSFENINLGVLIDSSILDFHDYKAEEILKEYYTAFDFCVVDLSHLPLENESGEKQTTGEDVSDENGEETSYKKLYSLITENTLIIAKYSLRLRFCAPTVEALNEVNRLVHELGIENYEIVSE